MRSALVGSGWVGRLARRAGVCLVVGVVGVGLGAGSVWGQELYGDDYGIAPVNGHPDAIQDAPAFPGDHAFWAGACDLSAAPGFGEDLGGLGGFGYRPDFVLAGAGGSVGPRLGVAPSRAQVRSPAAALPEHCIDPGTPDGYPRPRIWQILPYDTGEPAPPFGVGTIGQDLPPDCVFTQPYTPPVPPYPAEWDEFSPDCRFAPDWRLPPVTQAGAHPDGTTGFAWNRNDGSDGVTAVGKVDGSADNVYVDLPPGFVGNPNAVAECSNDEFSARPLRCPPQSQVGVLRLNLEAFNIGTPSNFLGVYDTTYPVYNLEPRKGRVAELGFGYAADFAAVRLVADARTNSDFGVTAFTGQIPAALTPVSQQITLWGVPWAAENDVWRPKPENFEKLGQGGDEPRECMTSAGLAPTSHQLRPEVIPPSGVPDTGDCRASYDPSWGPIRPFFSAQTECDGNSVTVTVRTDSYQNPGSFTAAGFPDPTDPDWKTYGSDSPPVTGCEKVPFEPGASFAPTTTAADAATGLRADVSVAQNNDPPAGLTAEQAADYWRSDAGLAASHLDKTVVELPEGLSLNPSSAAGLQACSDAQMGVRERGNPYLFDDTEPTCPDGSKIGTVTATTPLLDDPLTGEMYLGTPESTDPRSGSMFRAFLVLRDTDRGLLVKVFGTSTADGNIGDGGTGKLVAVFDNNPRVPVENIEVELKGGPRGLLATPPRCGDYTTDTELTPWSANPPVDRPSSFAIDTGCGFGFSPTLQAGSSVSKARGSGTFSLRLTRPEGQQTVSGLSVRMPQGLLASLRGVPLCSNAAGDAGACGEGSRIGVVDSAAGSGTPFVLERKGTVYLTDGYKGAPYGLSIVVPVEAGPFRGPLALKTLIVRAAIHVDRRTAEVTVVSDPLPQIWHGIPLRVREIVTSIDRNNFMLNPSDCSAKQIAADTTSPAGTPATSTTGFQATDCARLGFKPRLSIKLTGRRQMRTGRHPGVRAQVTQTNSQAGIEQAIVRLPKSLALDPNNAQALCEFADGTKPDLENHCPKGSIVGRARAQTPLLNQPLTGDVYFVKNIRIDPNTGNQIRTLPMIVVALRGEIAINLRGESNTTNNGRLVNTFNTIPDAPVTRFNLNIQGGNNGILAVTRTRRARINLCTKPRKHIATTQFTAHNNRTHKPHIRLTTPNCPKQKPKTNKGKPKRKQR